MERLSRSKRPSRRTLCVVDQQILRTLAQSKFANVQDLRAHLPGLTEHYNIFRRLRYLIQMGLIERLIGDGGARLGYILSMDGLLYAKKHSLANPLLLQSRPAFRSQYDHDHVVNEVRLILSMSPIVSNFVSETELRARNDDSRMSRSISSRDWKVPDGLFLLKSSGVPMNVALEVELTQKSKRRYAKIVEALLTSKSFQLVFFVCKDEKLVRHLAQAVRFARENNHLVRASNRSNGIYFSAVDLLRQKKLEAPWFGEGSSFSLAELASKSVKTA